MPSTGAVVKPLPSRTWGVSSGAFLHLITAHRLHSGTLQKGLKVRISYVNVLQTEFDPTHRCFSFTYNFGWGDSFVTNVDKNSGYAHTYFILKMNLTPKPAIMPIKLTIAK